MPSQPLGCPLQAKVRLAAWRMHLADEMLRVGRSSVAQVAERLGYQTGYAFRRVFRRVRGVGPGDVRRRARLGTVSSAAAEDER
jgi:AraC-like DNA-binding protein